MYIHKNHHRSSVLNKYSFNYDKYSFKLYEPVQTVTLTLIRLKNLN